MFKAYQVSVRKADETVWVTDYRPANSIEDARRDALLAQGVHDVKVVDLKQSWDSLVRELPGGDKFSWQGD